MPAAVVGNLTEPANAPRVTEFRVALVEVSVHPVERSAARFAFALEGVSLQGRGSPLHAVTGRERMDAPRDGTRRVRAADRRVEDRLDQVDQRRVVLVELQHGDPLLGRRSHDGNTLMIWVSVP